LFSQKGSVATTITTITATRDNIVFVIQKERSSMDLAIVLSFDDAFDLMMYANDS
jgi:hypothetical protein